MIHLFFSSTPEGEMECRQEFNRILEEEGKVVFPEANLTYGTMHYAATNYAKKIEKACKTKSPLGIYMPEFALNGVTHRWGSRALKAIVERILDVTNKTVIWSYDPRNILPLFAYEASEADKLLTDAHKQFDIVYYGDGKTHYEFPEYEDYDFEHNIFTRVRQ